MAMLSELLENGGELAYEHLIALDATVQRTGLAYETVKSFKRERHSRKRQRSGGDDEPSSAAVAAGRTAP
eukprot:COSAG05_NODE_22620_length_263_cov_0.951220_1_plen_69_part_01